LNQHMRRVHAATPDSSAAKGISKGCVCKSAGDALGASMQSTGAAASGARLFPPPAQQRQQQQEQAQEQEEPRDWEDGLDWEEGQQDAGDGVAAADLAAALAEAEHWKTMYFQLSSLMEKLRSRWNTMHLQQQELMSSVLQEWGDQQLVAAQQPAGAPIAPPGMPFGLPGAGGNDQAAGLQRSDTQGPAADGATWQAELVRCVGLGWVADGEGGDMWKGLPAEYGQGVAGACVVRLRRCTPGAVAAPDGGEASQEAVADEPQPAVVSEVFWVHRDAVTLTGLLDCSDPGMFASTGWKGVSARLLDNAGRALPDCLQLIDLPANWAMRLSKLLDPSAGRAGVKPILPQSTKVLNSEGMVELLVHVAGTFGCAPDGEARERAREQAEACMQGLKDASSVSLSAWAGAKWRYDPWAMETVKKRKAAAGSSTANKRGGRGGAPL
jgi:hypothetical protein